MKKLFMTLVSAITALVLSVPIGAQQPSHPPSVGGAQSRPRSQEIVDLLERKQIEVRPRGSGITDVSLEIRRRVKKPVNVRIPVGTFFISHDSSSQNMVSTAEETVVLENDAWITVEVDAACANRPRDIPDSGNTFDIQRSPQQQELSRLMPVLEKAGVASDVKQAAVWIVTDDADYDDLGTLVQREAFQFAGGTRVIQEEEAARAMQLVDQAGINITTKAIWRDRMTILKAVKDANLKAWLRRKAPH